MKNNYIFEKITSIPKPGIKFFTGFYLVAQAFLGYCEHNSLRNIERTEGLEAAIVKAKETSDGLVGGPIFTDMLFIGPGVVADQYVRDNSL